MFRLLLDEIELVQYLITFLNFVILIKTTTFFAIV